MRLLPAALFVFGMLGTARAQSPELMREYNAGVDAYRLGKLDLARAHLEKARAIDGKLAGPHRFLAAVARAQQRWDDCVSAARMAIVANPRSTELEDTRKLHESCRTAAGRAAYGGQLGDSAAIAITTNVPGATVRIGGLAYGGTPLAPRLIPAGKLAIDLEKTGWKPAHVDTDAVPGIVTDVAVELEADASAQTPEVAPAVDPAAKTGWLVVPPLASELPITSANPSRASPEAGLAIDGVRRPASPDGRYELAPGTHVVELRRPGHDPWRRRVRIATGQRTRVAPVFVPTAPRERLERTGLYLAGGGLALGGFGFAAFLLSTSASAEAREIARVETARTSPIDESVQPLRTRADFERARSRAQRWALVSNVSYAAALGALGAGAYFLLRGARPGDDAPAWAIAPISGGGALVATERTW